VSPAAFDRDPGAAATYVLRWGVDRATYGVDPQRVPYFLDGHAHDRPAQELYWLVTVVVGLPVGGLVAVCVRLDAERRDRRTAVLGALGASRRARAAVLAGEALVPVAVGASAALVPVLATTLTGVRLPITGHTVPAADLARAAPLVPLLWLLTVVLLLTAVTAGQLRVRGAPGTRPSAVADRAHAWAPFTFALFMALATGGALRRGGGGIASYLVGLLGALATLPLVAGRLAAALGGLVADVGHRTGRPAPIVAGRWLAARPAAFARLSAALVIGLCLVTLAEVSSTQLGTSLARDRRLSARIGDAVVEVRARWDAAELRRFAAAVGADRVLYAVTTGGDGVDLTGSCAALAHLGTLRTCPATATAVARTYSALTPAGRVVRDGSLFSAPRMSVRATGTPPTAAGLVVWNPRGGEGV
jgi:hypothetical protein